MDHSYESTKELFMQMIEFYRICDILKDKEECHSAYGYFHSSVVGYADGDIEYTYRIQRSGGYQEPLLETFTVPMDNDASFVYFHDGKTRFTFTSGHTTWQIISFESGETIAEYPILNSSECTKEMYEQLQFVYEPNVVHCMFILSLLQSHGLMGVFSYIDINELSAINAKLRDIWKI